MNKKLLERIAALKAELASADPKGIDSIVDNVGRENSNTQPAVEKIMGKMEARDGVGKYHVSQAALKKAIAMLKEAFGPDMMGGAAPAAAPAQLTPMDQAMGETPGMEMADAGNPALAPVEALEDEAQSFGDPALEALVHVIEMLIKKDMGGEEPAPAGVAVGPAGGAPDMGAAPDFGGGDDDAVGEAAPFGGADDAAADEGGDEGGESAAPFGGESEGSEPKSESKSEDKGDDDKGGEKKEKSESKEDKSDDDGGDDDEKKTAEAELFLLNRVIEAKKSELAAMSRVQALLSLSPEERLAKAAQFRKMAEMMEVGTGVRKTASLDDTTKEALLTVLAALEAHAGESDLNKEMPADPEEREEMAENLKHDKKAALLQHIAKLRMQKEATVDGKSMATPKEVPSADGTVESQLSGDAKIQYSPATSDRPISTIETKKQKLPSDKAHGDEAEMYFGNNQDAKTEIQTEKDSSKDVTNKRTLGDGEYAVQKSVPSNPVENMEKGKGSHQKEKDWEKTKSESNITPSGDRLVGLAADDIVGRVDRATKLARLAASKGIIASEDHFDEFVKKYAAYDDAKFSMAAELIEEAPARTGNRTAAVSKQAQDAVFEDNEAVQDAEEGDDEAPVSKKASLEEAKNKYADRIKPMGTLSKPISGPLESFRPPTPKVSNPRFAALADLDWDGPVTNFYTNEERGTLDRKTGYSG